MRYIFIAIMLTLALSCSKDKPSEPDPGYLVYVNNMAGIPINFYFAGQLFEFAQGQYKSIGMFSGNCDFRVERADPYEHITISYGNIVIDRSKICQVHFDYVEWQ